MKALFYFYKRLHAYAGAILYANLLGTTLIALLDSASVIMLAALLGVIGIIELPAMHIPGLEVLHALQQMPQQSALLIVLCLFAAAAIIQGLIGRNLGLRDVRIETGFVNHLRLDVYRSLLQSDWSFLMKKRKSDLIHSLTSELGRVTGSTYVLLQCLGSIVFTVIQIAICFIISWKMTLFVLGCGLVIALFSRRFIRRAKALGGLMTELAQSYLAGITDHFNGMKDIKGNLLESARYRWLVDWCKRIANERYENSKMRSNSQLLYKVFSTVMIAGFIYGSVVLFASDGVTLLLILAIFSRLWPRFTGIQASLENIAGAIPALQALMELQEESNKAQEMMSLEESAAQPYKLRHGLECRDVCFRYDTGQAEYTLRDVNVRIPANEITAVVGESGAGKSTLIDLLMGLIKPESGGLLVDGEDAGSVDVMAFRRSIGYVAQDPFLFHGTIRDNLLMANPEATDEWMWEALAFSSAAEFVRKLPQGLDALIGDRGIRLSGGERQRLVLARAILRKPSILVLDEATSSLDSVNETKIQEAIEKLKGKMTVIVIAHRLATIRNADQVIVMDAGTVVQSGQYGELSQDQNGQFSALLGNQLKVAL